MKNVIVFLLLSFSLTGFSQSSEVTLFDQDGDPIAYIDKTDEWTIYLWEGTPVAYVVNSNSRLSIYGFNGVHLGWLINGIIRNHEGKAVGFTKGSVNNILEGLEGYKGYKQYKPYKAYRESEPYFPYLSDFFSKTALEDFLLDGSPNSTDGRNYQIYDAPDPIMSTDLDLMMRVNIQKQRLSDYRAGLIQKKLDEIWAAIKNLYKYSKEDGDYQSECLSKNVKILSSMRSDLSDNNQFNNIYTPLNTHLNNVKKVTATYQTSE